MEIPDRKCNFFCSIQLKSVRFGSRSDFDSLFTCRFAWMVLYGACGYQTMNAELPEKSQEIMVLGKLLCSHHYLEICASFKVDSISKRLLIHPEVIYFEMNI